MRCDPRVIKKKLADNLKITGVIGDKTQLAAGFEAAYNMHYVILVEKTPFMMASFGPGIGEINVKDRYLTRWEVSGDKISRIGVQETHIRNLPAEHAIDTVKIILIGPFDPQIVDIRMEPGLI